MKTVLGPFQPHLENALVDTVRKFKEGHALSPLLILVPSDMLRRRLKISLTAEARMNLLNVYILTFHQLYLRLLEESRSDCALNLADDTLMEAALDHWIKNAGPESAAFSTVADTAGGPGALWQTLRDLKDGGVQPADLSSALDEGLCNQRERETLAALAAFYGSFTASCKQWGLCDYSDFVSIVHQCVESSRFLKTFPQIFYYGFYDLTQVQLDVFHHIIRHYPTTLFFPLLTRHPGWLFAERFYQRHVQGLASEEEHLCPRASAFPLFVDQASARPILSNPPPSCAIFSCSGPRDEVLTAAKEILRLNRDEGMAFSEIGVVARTLEPYTQWIKETFRDHRIPFSTSAEQPLLEHPLAAAVGLLLRLARNDYLRSHFIDLVSSPFFNLSLLPADSEPRPDIWDLLTRRLGITRGAEEWARLKRYLERDLTLTTGDEETSGVRALTVNSAQAALLWRLFEEIEDDLSRLPPRASWSHYVGLWQQLLEKYLGIECRKRAAPAANADKIVGAISASLTSLLRLDPVQPEITRAQFLQTWQRWLERTAVPLIGEEIAGVVVLDAMAARGARFRAVFSLGLNEGLFPRTIREDAFLRDRTRRMMETVLGYKVSEKLAAFDEEKLLFTLLVSAATERLYCLYQRSDDNGRTLARSWYLEELEQALAATGSEITRSIIPRAMRDKKEVEPFKSVDFLLPEEAAIRLSLDGEDPGAVLDDIPDAKLIYRSGTRFLELIEDANTELSPADGLTGHLAEYWRYLAHEGLAPTALERYGRCPFQFFAFNVLGLRPLERPEEQSGLESSELGNLIHRILNAFFQELIDGGYFNSPGRTLEMAKLLQNVAQTIFVEYESDAPVGYKLVWELWQEQILALLRGQTERDIEDLQRSGRRPVNLEIELQGKLPEDWPFPAGGLPIYGTVDRIDFDSRANRYRVIDYKFTMRNKPSALDNNLQLAAARGEKLQPPLYLLLAKRFAEERGITPAELEATFYYLAPKWEDGPFLQRSFAAENLEGFCGQGLRETVSLFVRGIHDGRYFIRPGKACDTCEVTHVCRRNHLPTVWRTANDLSAQAHAQAVKRTFTKE